MPQLREVTSVLISKSCMESYPCQHNVSIYYSDGSIENTIMTSRDILARFRNFLTQDQITHMSW